VAYVEGIFIALRVYQRDIFPGRDKRRVGKEEGFNQKKSSERISIQNSSKKMSEPPQPAEPLAPGNYDKSWNDPPLFSYSHSYQIQSQQTGPKLSKRVGFSSAGLPPTKNDSKGDGSCQLHDAGARPLGLGPSIAPPSMPLMLNTGATPRGGCLPPSHPPLSGNPAQASDPSVHEETPVGINQSNICDNFKNGASRYCGDKAADIIKRLSLMEKSMLSGAFPLRILKLLDEISKAIESENCLVAERKITTLSADYSGDCAQWIIALRHILTAMRQQQSKAIDIGTDGDGEGLANGTPYFVPMLAPTQQK